MVNLFRMLMNNLFSLKGKTAWITGGKRVGQRVAEILAENGANLIISYNNSRKEAEDTAKKAGKYGVKTLIIKVDVSSRQNVRIAVNEIRKKFGKIDILVLMASIFEKIDLMSITEDDFKRNFDVHVGGTFWPIRESLNLMPKGSHVITVCDRTSIGNVYPNYLPYVVTKAAVASLTRDLAIELGSKGIFINSIAPGPILKTSGLGEDYWQEIRKSSIVKYPITDKEAIDEFAKLVLYLSNVKSTGSIYSLDLGNL